MLYMCVRSISQVRILVQDGGSPPRDATSILTINMERNEFPPEFINNNYEETILETLPIGSAIIRVTADDRDQKPPHNVVTYELDHPYFSINTETGDISLKRSLLGDGTESYRVRGRVELGW